MEKCRVCLQNTTEHSFSLKDIASIQKITFEEVYFYVTTLNCFGRGPQYLCGNCTEELLATYEFKKRCEKNELLFEKETFYVKTELDTDWKEEVETKIETDLSENVNERDLMDDKKAEPENAKTVQCSYCPLISSKAGLVKHCKLKHPKDKLKCTEDGCSYEYFLSFQISTHMTKAHETEMPFKCDDCSETFQKKIDLRRHRLAIHNIRVKYRKSMKSLICPHCGKVLSCFGSLQIHIQSVHEKHLETYVCDLCGATAKTHINLANHMRRRHIEQPLLKCRYCPEIFKNYAKRNTHEVRYHTKAFRHSCKICGSQFIVSTKLRKHMLKHTGEKNFVCTSCDARFGTSYDLNRHLETHTDVKAFVCDICNAAFKTKHSLYKHSKVHQERNYECPVCGQKFLINQQMRQHVVRNHPEYELPPPGTVMNKIARARLEDINLKKQQLSLVKPESS